MQPILVIGGGGHGRVVIEALRAAGTDVAGVIDRHPAVAAMLPDGVPWLGGDEALVRYLPADYQLANGVGGIGEPHRRGVFERLGAAGYGFVRVRHPTAIVARAGVVLGEGCRIMAGAVIQSGVRIGADTIVNTRAAIDHDCRIGEHCHIAPGAVLCGEVEIGAGTHIGAGAVIIEGVRIGSFSIVGAGSVILRDVPDGVVVYSKDMRQERRR
jgi:sugar O-acyltransferase (sialic acid O-acetyltransferase NeuD family)